MRSDEPSIGDAGSIGPAPTLLPRIALPLLTESHLYALLAG